jgi:hypothetical protein
MKPSTRKRVLAFERLETKATPSSLLLSLAPLDEPFHVNVEQLRDAADAPSASWVDVDTSANWQFQFTTSDVLQFVNDNTVQRRSDTSGVATPTRDQCRHVDEMMKLNDGDARALIMADSLAQE